MEISITRLIRDTGKYELVEVDYIYYTIIRKADKLGLPLYGGTDSTRLLARNWANVCASDLRFNYTQDYEFKTCDELVDFSHLYIYKKHYNENNS